MFEDIQNYRQSVVDAINKAFTEDLSLQGEEDLFDKARYEGDLFFQDGKTYVWTQYAPGKFDWHVVKSTSPVIRGKGVGGKHGIPALKVVYGQIDPKQTDPAHMNLKRTPNGNWRLYYDDQDSGVSIDGDTFTESELRNDNVCYQSRRTVDNFDMVKNYMEFPTPDDVYFVQIIKRWKDNKDKPNADAWKAQGKIKGSYHSGAEYLNYYLIKGASELDALKPEIIKVCSYNNARAYISINSRKRSQVNAYMAQFRGRFSPSDPRYKNAEAILYGMAKSGDAWKNERFKVLLDIDTTRDSKVTMNGKSVNVWDETRKRLTNYGIKIAAEYETPSGGLHLILNNKNNRNLKPFYAGLKDFDGGRDLGKLALVHPSEDIKMVLYSNVDTAGY